MNLLKYAPALAAATVLAACGGGGSKEASIGQSPTGEAQLSMSAGTTLLVPGTVSTDGITLAGVSWKVQAKTAGAPALTLSNDGCTSVVRNDFAPPAGGGHSTWGCDLTVIAPANMDADAEYALIISGVDTRQQVTSTSKSLKVLRNTNTATDPNRYANAAGPSFAVAGGQLATLRCNAADARWYQWVIADARGTNVTLSQNAGSEVQFTAPVVAAPTPLVFECRAAVQDRVYVSRVTATINPVVSDALVAAIAGPRFITKHSQNNFQALGTWFNPSGNIVGGAGATYEWSILGPVPAGVTLSSDGGPIASVGVSTVTSPALLPLRVVATAGGQTSEARHSVILDPATTAITLPSLAPAVQVVKSGDKVTITATGVGTAQAFEWAVVSGPNVLLGAANTSKVEFIAPTVGATTQIVLRVAVSYVAINSPAPPAAFLDAVVQVTP